MKKIIAVLAAVLVLLASACSVTGTKPFKDLTSDEIESVSVNCIPPDKTVETDDTDRIDELVEILNRLVIYDEDDKEYAGQSVTFTITKTDGTVTRINAYNPQLIIDGVKYSTKQEPCSKLNDLGNRWIDELSADGKTFDEVKKLLSEYPSDYSAVLGSGCYVNVHGEVKAGEDLKDKFLSDVDNGIASEIVTVQFTTEGDPIYDYISFSGEDFYCVEDCSRDRFKGSYDDYTQYRYKHLIADGDRIILVNDENISSYEQVIGSEELGSNDYRIIF